MAHIMFLAGPGSAIPLEDDSQLADLVFRLRKASVEDKPVTFTVDGEGSAEADHLFIPPGTAFVAHFDGGYPSDLEKRVGDMLDGVGDASK